MANSYIDLKKSFEYVGDNSTFQKRITWIFVVQWIAFSYIINSMAVLFRDVKFECRKSIADSWSPCENVCARRQTYYRTINAENQGQWFNSYQKSITEQFQLYCQKQYWKTYAQTSLFVGGILSGYIFSYLSSKFGKRSVLFLIMIIMISSLLVCTFAPNIQIFVIGYFFIGFSMFGYQTSVYIYIAQISGKQYAYLAERFRTISINMLTMTWAATPIFLPLFNLVPSWKHMFIFFCAILVFTLPFAYFSFQESPRFLVSKKCYKQAREIFHKISIINKRPPYNFKLIQQIEFENEKYLRPIGLCQNENKIHEVEIEDDKNIKSYFYSHLFKYKSLRRITFVLMWWWIFRFFMYFSLNLSLIGILADGMVLTMVIAGAAIAQVMGSLGLCKNVIKTVLVVLLLCYSIMWLFPISKSCKQQNVLNYQSCSSLVVMIALVVVIKFFNTIFYSNLIVYSSQVYPTPVRSIGFGFVTTFGRLSTIIVSPYILYMKEREKLKEQQYQANSLSILAPCALFAFILCFLMPYTEKTGMRETIQEQQKSYEMIEL